jgi:hypothetical protein
VGLYRDSWSDPEVRWLLSCVPTGMIFDDHDVRDDWNTSGVWRRQMAEKPWWRDRIRSALASYWVYQHLGNLPAADLAADPDFREISAAEGDAWPLLAALADRADSEVDGSKGVRFSFRWDLGATRFIMIDSRNGRILGDGTHLMLAESEFAWIEEQVHAPGEVDHLVLGTSLPWLLPHAIGDVQSITERAAARPGLRGRLAEAVRQGADLEHWQAFRSSFDRLTALIVAAATGRDGPPPATVSVLSGDVHHSYAARARFATPTRSRVYQLTCSPVRNGVPWFMEYVFALGWSRRLSRLLGRVARSAGLDDPPLDWSTIGGPWFGNAVSTLEVTGRDAHLRVERSGVRGGLEAVATLPLT